MIGPMEHQQRRATTLENAALAVELEADQSMNEGRRIRMHYRSNGYVDFG